MSKFTLHLDGTLLGMPVGHDEAETDSELGARFYLVTSLLKGLDAPAPVSVQVHVHGDGTLSADRDEEMNLTTVLLTASAITGEPYQTWVERGEQFRAEHDGEGWDGLKYDEDTDTVSLTLDDTKAAQAQEAKAATEGLDEEFESLLATADTADTEPTEGE